MSNDETTESSPLLQVEGLKKYFSITKGFFSRVKGTVKAVDDVNFTIFKGENVGLVGESGCGKTTLGRCLLRLLDPTDGHINFNFDHKAVDLLALNKKELRAYRRYIQMIFQDPYSSLNPRMPMVDIVGEPLKVNGIAKGDELEERVRDLVDTVGLDVRHLRRYPHAFSGGQRQRIGLARALSVNPPFIIADEPTSALDVSVQATILNLLQDLQEQFNLSMLFITHDLSVIHHICQRVMVMYLGNVVEVARTKDLFTQPLHPYTETLLKAVPKIGYRGEITRFAPPGEPPDPANAPAGCYFHPRCPYAQDICKEQHPALEEWAEGRYARCHFAKELSLKGVGSE